MPSEGFLATARRARSAQVSDLRLRCTWQDQQELVAPDAGHLRTDRGGGAQDRAAGVQHQVADLVSVPVVHALEAVQVQHAEREFAAPGRQVPPVSLPPVPRSQPKPPSPWRTLNAFKIDAEWVDWFNYRRLYELCDDIPLADLRTAYYRRDRAHHEAEFAQH